MAPIFGPAIWIQTITVAWDHYVLIGKLNRLIVVFLSTSKTFPPSKSHRYFALNTQDKFLLELLLEET